MELTKAHAGDVGSLSRRDEDGQVGRHDSLQVVGGCWSTQGAGMLLSCRSKEEITNTQSLKHCS